MTLAALLLGFPNPLAPIVVGLGALLGAIDGVTHSIGWSLVLLAALISGALWPLRDKQFKSAAAMQKIAPEVKKLQARFKGDPTALNTATMELYKERGVNPLASCLPMLLQLPILFSVYQAINGHKEQFVGAGWLWIGTPFAANSPGHVLAASLFNPDYLLLALYMISMFFSFKLAAPPADPQQAQQQQIMAFMSPAMIGFFGFKQGWPSALIVYWLSSNLFTMTQQLIMMRGRRNAEALAAASAPVVVTAPLSNKAQRRLRQNEARTALTASGTSVTSGKPGSNGKSGSNGAKLGPASAGTATNAAAKRRRG